MKLLVIDIQKGITDERLYAFDTFIENTKKILETARKNRVEVLYIMHDDGPGSGFSVGDDDFEIAKEVTPNENEKIFVKTINSAFGNSVFAEYLESTGEKELMIVGLQTNFCIDATVKSAFERGYNVIIPHGTNSTFDNAFMDAKTTCQYYNEMMWPDRFARCVSLKEAVDLLSK